MKLEYEHHAHIEEAKLERDKVKTLEELFEKLVNKSDLDQCDVAIVHKG